MLDSTFFSFFICILPVFAYLLVTNITSESKQLHQVFVTLGPVSSSFRFIFGQACIYVCIHLTFVIICNFQVYNQFTVQTCLNDKYVYSPIKARVGVRVTKGCHGFRSPSVCPSVRLSFLHIILQLEGIPPGLYCSHFASYLFSLCNLQFVCSAFPWQLLSRPLNQLSICFHLHLAELSPISRCDLVAPIFDNHAFRKLLV